MELSTPQLIAVYAIPVIFAITLHEAAHALVANRLGDPTARLLGRLSFNPIRHIDPVGTLLVPGLILLTSKALGAPALFGWAKPVPVAQANLRNPRRDMGLVALAGPAANLLMALGWGLLLKLLVALDAANPQTEFVVRMALAGITVNLVLAVLNMMPVPPLDGGRVLSSLLPPPAAAQLARIEPYGIVVVLLLLFSGALHGIVLPLVELGYGLLVAVLDL